MQLWYNDIVHWLILCCMHLKFYKYLHAGAKGKLKLFSCSENVRSDRGWLVNANRSPMMVALTLLISSIYIHPVLWCACSIMQRQVCRRGVIFDLWPTHLRYCLNLNLGKCIERVLFKVIYQRSMNYILVMRVPLAWHMKLGSAPLVTIFIVNWDPSMYK